MRAIVLERFGRPDSLPFWIPFGSFVFGTPQFTLSDAPLQKIAEQVAAGCLKSKPTRVFRFEEIRGAHHVMEANEAGGKMVVVRDS